MEGLCSEFLIRGHKDWIKEGYCTLVLVRNSDQTVQNRPLEKSLVRIFDQRAWRLDTRGLLHVGSGQKFWPKMFLKASGNRVLSEIASRSPLDLLKRFILLQMSQTKKSVTQNFPWNLSSCRPNSNFWQIQKQVHWRRTQRRKSVEKLRKI